MELLHDPVNECSHLVERFNAWYVSERPVTWKDYLDGQAYLEWNSAFPVRGVWHKAFFVTKKIDPILDDDFGLVRARDVAVTKVTCTCHDQNSPVFVDQVQLVKVDQSVCPSWIWFQITNNLLGGFTGFPNFVFNPLSEIEPVGRGRKARIIGRASVGDGTCRNEVVQGCPEVVDRIADDDRDFCWQWLGKRYVEPMLARTKVTFMPNAVRVLAEVAENEVVKFGDVRLRALQLQ